GVPHLKGSSGEGPRSGRDRLAVWRGRRRMAEYASSEVEPPAELQEASEGEGKGTGEGRGPPPPMP
ncbi:MAG TPA: hypothetical protein VF697_09650, partial [Archangium sp.]